MRTDLKTRRQLALAVALLTQRRISRDDVFSIVDGYASGHVAATRRLYEDVRDLEREGFVIDSADDLRLTSRGLPTFGLADHRAIFDAAKGVGEGFAFETALRTAVLKLTGRKLPRATGPSRAAIYAPNMQAIKALVWSLAHERVIYAPGREIEVHGLLLDHRGISGLCLDSAGARLRIDCDQRLFTNKSGQREFARQSNLPWQFFAAKPLPAKRPRAIASPIGNGAISQHWTLAAYLASAGVARKTTLAQALGVSTADLGPMLANLNLASINSGEYLLYAVHGPNRIRARAEMHTDLLAQPWPLTGLEVQALYAALLLADRRDLVADLEQQTQIPTWIYVDPAIVATAALASTPTKQLQVA